MSAIPTQARATRPVPPRLHIVPEPTPHLSYSQVRTYSTCSLKWWYSRRFKPAFVPSALVFGKAWHAAVECYYQLALEGRPQNLTTLLDAFFTEYRQEKQPIQYGKNDAQPSAEQVTKMLQCFLQSVKPGKVIAIEQEIRCPLGEGMPELLGYIDLVEITQDEQGRYALNLIDLKTCARTPKDSIDPDQLVLYDYAVRKTGLLSEFHLPIQLRYDYMVKTKEPQYGILPVAAGRSERVLEKIKHCWRGMGAGIAYPCPGWQCAGCGYKARCGKWPKEV